MRKTPDLTAKPPLKPPRKPPAGSDRLSRNPADDTANVLLGPPDATNRLSRAALQSAASPGPATPFLWPAPPYYDYAEPNGPAVIEDCLLTLGDDVKVSGTLLSFSPDEELLKFQQRDAGTAVSIAFSTLLAVELLRPVEVKRQTLPGHMARRVFAASDRQPYAVRLVNGKLFQGHTVGHIEALCGLFLFPPGKNDRLVRHFIPAHAVQDRRIGKPLGQMLVDQNLVSSELVDSALQKQISLRGRRFGEYLTENQIVSAAQLDAALKQQQVQPVQRLGETLVELGYLTQPDLDTALAIEQRNRSIPLGQILTDMEVLDASVINSVMAKKLGIPFVNLSGFDIAPEILGRIPPAVAYRYHMIPVAESEHALVVAVDNPMNMTKMDELRFVAGSRLIPVMASADDIRLALQRNYGPPDKSEAAVPVEELTARLTAESAELGLEDQHAAHDDSTLVKLVNTIILDAVEQKASDIHIEANPGGTGTRIRFRKDGALVTYLELPARFRRAVISRLKVMSQLDITERRKPQDGKIDFGRFGPARTELRIATIPTANGLEDVVMRVLSAATPVSIDQLGFDAEALAAIKRMMSRPHGLFLVCGPTGSGKTTTLHSLLGHLNTDDRKIWTAEDPIEIAQPGLRQVQVNSKIGWTFATAMRSFLRADPDIIMVGEMRDAETARIVVEASLTGHLVLSTLHTNSAAESVVRLLDLGMDPFNFADALLGVLSQRLVRQLCAKCKKAYPAPGAELEELAMEYCIDTPVDIGNLLDTWRKPHAGSDGRIVLYRAHGCPSCDNTGYKGRMGLYELMVADAALKRLIQGRAPISEITAAAMANGMRTLKQDGIGRILQGLTDIRQVHRV
jgi:type II secretory ATPase GspE/PulE/Tfp pilus assembly ATPase PilB-like protein